MALTKLTLLTVLLGVVGSNAAFTIIDILNLALNLECLEAEFYSYAAYGVGMNASLRAGGPAPIGGSKADLGAFYQRLAEDIALDEVEHVELLRATLGPFAVPCPLISLKDAFAEAGDLAFGTSLAYKFNPFKSDITFLHGAFIFEDVGVTAYNGAIPAAYAVSAARARGIAGFLGTESYHAGAIRELLIQQEDTYVFPYGVTVQTLVGAISALRGKFGSDQSIFYKGASNLVPANTDALALSRTAEQVLGVVYLGGTTKGGFFPNGVNGNINSTLI